MSSSFDNLDQYDFVDEEYIEKVKDKYSPLIGDFIIKFSALEHTLNILIAEILSQRSHDFGYTIAERLTINNKIELFYKMYLQLVSVTDKKKKVLLDSIKKRLIDVNSFRNNLVHANWLTLKKDGSVRSKIVTDNEEGYVKFKNSQITPKIIKGKIAELKSLVYDLDEFSESALSF